MTEILLNGVVVDLEDNEVITATYGNISFGEFNKKKGIKTNAFKLPKTNKNKRVLENAHIIQNATNIPYRFINIVVLQDGVEVMNGLTYIKDTGEFFELNSISGISEFYNTISARNIRDLDLSQYDHTWNRDNITGSWSNTEGYIYAWVSYGLAWEFRKAPPNYLLPQIFFHTIVKKIISDAGYQVRGKVLTDTRFLNHVIVYNQFPLTVTYDGPITLTSGLPDVAQSKIILDFMNCYGLMPNINNVDMIITFDYIDDIIFKEPIDWSHKIDDSEEPEISYDLGYAIESTLSYNTDDSQTNGREKTVIIDNETIDKKGNIYKSDFFVMDITYVPEVASLEGYPENGIRSIQTKQGNFIGIYDAAVGWNQGTNVIHNGIYYQSLLPSGGNTGLPAATPGEAPETWKPGKPTDVFTFKSRAAYGMLETIPSWPFTIQFSPSDVVSITKVIQGERLDWEYIYPRCFKVFDRILQQTKIVTHLMKLNYSDINQLDFTRPYWLDRYNSLFILEEVTQYKLNQSESTPCTFIRI